MLDREIDWFVLKKGEYQRLPPDADGVFRSNSFPGLWLNRKALLERNHAAVVESVLLGVQGPEHAAFVEHLAATRTKSS